MISLKKGFVLAFFGNVAYGLQMLLIASIISKLGTAVDLGFFGYASAVLSPLYVLVSLNLRTLVITANDNTDINAILFLRFLQFFIYLVLCFGISLFHDHELAKVVFVCSLLKGAELIVDLLYAGNLRINRVDIVAKSQILRSVVIVLCFFIIFNTTRDLWKSILISAVVSIAILRLYDWPRSSFQKIFRFKGFAAMNKTLLNLNFNNISFIAIAPLLDSLLQNAPRFALTAAGCIEEVAVFTVIWYTGMPGILIAMAFASVITPRLRIYWSDGDINNYTKYSIFGIVGGLCIGLIGFFFVIMFGDTLIGLVFSNEYTGFQYELGVMLIGCTFWFSSAMCGVALNSAQNYKAVLYSNLIGMCTCCAFLLFSMALFNSKLHWVLFAYCISMFARFLSGIYFVFNQIITSYPRNRL